MLRPKKVKQFNNNRKSLAALSVGFLCLALQSPAATDEAIDDAPKELLFVLKKVDGPVHNPAQHTYWFGPFAECATVLDVNGDGKLDIAAGRNYYLAPQSTKFAVYRDCAQANVAEMADTYEAPME